MMFARYSIAKFVGIATAVAALGLTTAAPATADATDQEFLRRVAAEGIMFSTSATVITKAQEVCEAFSAGRSGAGVQETMLSNTAMTPAQMSLFIAESVQAYCPGYADSPYS